MHAMPCLHSLFLPWQEETGQGVGRYVGRLYAQRREQAGLAGGGREQEAGGRRSR